MVASLSQENAHLLKVSGSGLLHPREIRFFFFFFFTLRGWIACTISLKIGQSPRAIRIRDGLFQLQTLIPGCYLCSPLP